MSLTRVLSNLNSMLTRRCSVGALLVLLALSAVAQQTTNLALPPGRVLFIVDTSLSMRGRADGIQYVMETLLASGLNGRLRPGDTLGLWTFNEAVNAGKFPLHSWSSSARETVTTNVVRFLKQQRYEKKADLDKALTQAFPLVRDSAIITLVLITDGALPVHGTPFDEAINATFKEAGREQKRVRMPFVTVLRAERGKIVSGVVGQPPWPIDIPMLPCEQKALAAAKSPPPKPATNAPPPKVASTKPRETIVIAKPATNAPVTAAEAKSAPAPAETPKPAPVPAPEPAVAEKPAEPVPAVKPPAPTTVATETPAKEDLKPSVVPASTTQVPPAIPPANSQPPPASEPGKPPAVTQTAPTPTTELPKPITVAAETKPAKVELPDPAAPAKQTDPVLQAVPAEQKAEAKPVAAEAKSRDHLPTAANVAPPAPSVPPPLTVQATTAAGPAVAESPSAFASNAPSQKPTPVQTALATPAQPFLSGPRLLLIGLLLLGVAGILFFLIVRRTRTGPAHGSLITQSFDRDKDQP